MLVSERQRLRILSLCDYVVASYDYLESELSHIKKFFEEEKELYVFNFYNVMRNVCYCLAFYKHTMDTRDIKKLAEVFNIAACEGGIPVYMDTLFTLQICGEVERRIIDCMSVEKFMHFLDKEGYTDGEIIQHLSGCTIIFTGKS